MRINDDIPPKGVDRKKGGSSTAARKADSGGLSSLFAGALRRQEQDLVDRQQELQELKREIDEAGDQLDKEPSMANFKAFRALITQLSRKVLTGAYKVQMQSSPNSPNCLELVTVIDQKADELYRLVMGEQKDRLKITHKIMEMKGLVVDFLQ